MQGGPPGLLPAVAPPPFLSKAYSIVDDPLTDHVVRWSGPDSFLVADPGEFSAKVILQTIALDYSPMRSRFIALRILPSPIIVQSPGALSVHTLESPNVPSTPMISPRQLSQITNDSSLGTLSMCILRLMRCAGAADVFQAQQPQLICTPTQHLWVPQSELWCLGIRKSTLQEGLPGANGRHTQTESAERC